MWYLVIKVLHVLAAVVAVGSNVTYGIWIASGSRDPAVLPFALRGVKTIDDRLANPAYGLLLLTGALMVIVGGIRASTSWLVMSFGLYVAVVLVGLLGSTPTLKKQIQLLASDGPSAAAYTAASKRGITLGIVLGVLTVVIIVFMVTKPSLW